MVQIFKSSIVFCVLALAAVGNVKAFEMTSNDTAVADTTTTTATTTATPVAADTNGYKASTPAAIPAARVVAPAGTPNTKKARGEIAAGGEIAVGPNVKAKGGFKAAGEINKLKGADAATAGVGGGAVTGPADGWKAKGVIGAGGNINNGGGGKMAEGGFKADGEISSIKGVGANGQAVVAKNAKGSIAAGGEIETKSVKAKGGFQASGELLSVTGTAPGPGSETPLATPPGGDVLAVQGVDTTFGEGKYYRRAL